MLYLKVMVFPSCTIRKMKVKILIEMNGISIFEMNRLSKEKNKLHIVN